jgi:hypothetical protein
MGKRRRGRKGTAAQEFIKEDLKTRIGQMMDNRRRILAPFPVAAEDLYWLAWTKQERTAIELLLPYGENLFEMGAVMLLTNYEFMDAKKYRITVRLPQEMPAKQRYNTIVEWGEVPIEFAKPIVDWFPLWKQHKDERNELLTKLENVADYCKTYGQVYRVWPDLLGFFDEEGREKINSAKVKSKLPDDLMIWDHDLGKEVLMEEFRPAAFEPFTTMIAECLMLPEIDAKEVGTVELMG